MLGVRLARGWMIAMLALSGGALGCARSSPPPANENPPELPRDLLPAVQEAERLGRAMFDQDLAASRATEAVIAAMGSEPDTQIEGWISRHRGDHWLVEFFVPSPDGYLALWQAEVKGFAGRVPAQSFTPPRPLDDEGNTMAKARATAIAQPFRACSSRYNALVLPGSLIGKTGHLVYLLAGSSESGEWMVGGHQRFLISNDGQRVLEHRSLSRGCLSVPASPRGERGSSAWVTHIVGDAPAESHVFLSLVHQAPLFVGTRRGAWRVTGEKISFGGEQP